MPASVCCVWQISDIQVSGQSEDMTAKEKLLLWSQRMVEGYQGLRCDNFTTSWRDGRLFNAIIHRHKYVFPWNRGRLEVWEHFKQVRAERQPEELSSTVGTWCLQGVLNSCNFLWEVPGAGPCCLHQGLSETPLFVRLVMFT